MKFDYDLLTALAAVAREGAFDAAAKSLGLTQSAVSQRIKLLEERAGAVLILRGRPCEATPIGFRLIEHLETVTLLQNEVRAELSAVTGTDEKIVSTIRISVNNDSLATWFPTVVKRAKIELGVRLDIIPDDQAYTEERLKSGEAIAVVTGLERPVSGCHRTPLGAMSYIAVSTPDLFERYFHQGVSTETLRGTACLAWDRKDTIQDQWMKNALGEAVDVVLYYVPSFNGYLECCLNGTAWGLFPKASVEPYLASGALLEMTPEHSVRVMLNWQAINHPSQTLTQLEQIVVDVAKQHLRTEAGSEL